MMLLIWHTSYFVSIVKMGNILVLVLLNLFYVTAKASNPRSVNVALETSLVFQPGDENNYSFINKIRSFIDQIEQAISPVKALLRTTDNTNGTKIFSKFMDKITRNIIKYEDEDLKEIAKLLANEAEIFLNQKEVLTENAKTAMLNALKEYSRVNPDHIRYNLQNALNGNEIIFTTLADKIDNYYDYNDKAKLDELINRSDRFAKEKSGDAKKELQDMVKRFINIFKDKYYKLDELEKSVINRDFGYILQYIDLSKIYSSVNNKKPTERNQLVSKHHKNGNPKNTKKIVFNKDVEIFVKSIKNTTDGTDKANEKNASKENDFEMNKLENNSADLSTVLDELNKS